MPRVLKMRFRDAFPRSPSRASKLLAIKEKAREIREQHRAGKLSAEDAASKLRSLHSSKGIGELTAVDVKAIV